MTEPLLTKPGRHGTLYSFEIEVVPADPGQARYTIRRWAYDEDHVADRLNDDPMMGGDDWRILGRVRA